MPQVSKKILAKDIEEKMYAIFWDAFASISSPKDIRELFDDLLGPVEKTMLAKRLAIALLLSKGYSYENIRSTLKVSFGTIARVNVWLNIKGVGYRIVVKKILHDQQMEDFWKKIEDTLISLLPPLSSPGKSLRGSRAKRKPRGSLG